MPVSFLAGPFYINRAERRALRRGLKARCDWNKAHGRRKPKNKGWTR